MRRILLLLILPLFLSSCQKKLIHIDLYILGTCGSCLAAKSYLEDYTDKHENAYLTIYDLDESASLKRYQKVMKKIHYSKQVTPVIVMRDHFVKIGYNANDQKDLEKAFAGKKVTKKAYYSLT
jgi:glutaredoxin